MRGANLDRIEQVISLRQKGLTYDAIGKSLTPPVCRERIRQMLVMWDVSLTGQLPRKPKPPKSVETPTQMLHSLANGSVTVVDSIPEE